MTRLPRIACFHGGGSNGTIFAIQCARLQDVLKDDFEFVYFDAPFERSAGPGVLPWFEDYGPFKSWFKIDEDGKERSDGSGYDRVGADGIERALKLMEAEGPAGDWVAAMGFSQGTRVVGGLLCDQQKRSEAGNPRDIDLKFGVLCMGGGAPMVSEISHATNRSQRTTGFASGAGSDINLITIPTLHLHGLKDTNLNNGRKQLADHYDQKMTTLYEIDYHHAMPWVTAEIWHFADLIKQMYKNTANRPSIDH